MVYNQIQSFFLSQKQTPNHGGVGSRRTPWHSFWVPLHECPRSRGPGSCVSEQKSIGDRGRLFSSPRLSSSVKDSIRTGFSLLQETTRVLVFWGPTPVQALGSYLTCPLHFLSRRPGTRVLSLRSQFSMKLTSTPVSVFIIVFADILRPSRFGFRKRRGSPSLVQSYLWSHSSLGPNSGFTGQGQTALGSQVITPESLDRRDLPGCLCVHSQCGRAPGQSVPPTYWTKERVLVWEGDLRFWGSSLSLLGFTHRGQSEVLVLRSYAGFTTLECPERHLPRVQVDVSYSPLCLV